MIDLTLSCKCGALQGALHDVSPKTGSHVICYCKDCQASAHHLGADDMLDDKGGSNIFQTLPSHLEIVQGHEHLACLRLSPKGLMRWYASCCNTPMFNTLGSKKLRFIGVLTNVAGDNSDLAFGPVIAIANTTGAVGGEKSVKEKGKGRAVFNILARHFGAVLAGDHKTEFFDSTGEPVVKPSILTLEERTTATPK